MASLTFAFRRSQNRPGGLVGGGVPDGRDPTATDRDLVRRWSESGLLIGCDAVVLFTACVLAAPRDYAMICAAAALAAASAAGLHRPRLGYSVLDDLPRIVVACAIAVAGAYVVLPQWIVPDLKGYADGRPLRVFGAVLVALAVGRTAAYGLIRAVRRRRPGRPVLVIGVEGNARRLVRTLFECPEFGLEPAGCVAVGPIVGEPPVPLLGKVDELALLVAESRARYLVIALGAGEEGEADLVGVLLACGQLPCRVFVLPHLYEIQPRSSAVEEIRGIPLVRIRCGRPGKAGLAGKRLFDMVLAGVALVLISPLFLALGLAVRLEGGRGVLFRQTRIGRDGRPFTLLKFRTMRPSSQAEADTNWNIAGDARIGAVGGFLRRTSLDELPQLVNVVRGEMSLIGPRPERPHFVDEFSVRYQRYVHRHRMDAGLTGLAQINGLRGDTSIDDRALLDNRYIENWSFWLDVKIALRTAAALFKGAK